MPEPRIVTIDGPSGSGKGTIASRLARQLGWRFLDSGALYRLVGLDAETRGIDFSETNKIKELASFIDVEFEEERVLLNGREVTEIIRTEAAGNNASRVAAIPEVREALLEWQRGYARAPGLVADGRDMGTVVFPHAQVKIFLDASPEERARRRHKQLKEKGFSANLASLVGEIRERDERDRNRPVAPLFPAADAVVIDSTRLSIGEVLADVRARINARWPDLAA
ncbi:MAG: (d)CMP kinase [Pseudomonadota bacterium]